MKSILNYKITIIILTVSSVILLAGTLLFGLLWLTNNNKIVYGLSVANQKIGGLQTSEAKNILSNRIKQVAEQKIIIEFNNRQWHFSANELGVNFNLEATFSKISYSGHQPNIFSSLKKQLKSLLFGKNLPLDIIFDTERFNETISTFAPIIEEPAQNAKLTYDQKKDEFFILPESSGKSVNLDLLKKELLANLSQLSDKKIELQLQKDLPQVTEKDLQMIKNQAEQIVNQTPFYLQNGDFNLPIDKQEMAQWMSVIPSSGQLTTDQDVIKNYLAQIAPTVNRESINAKLTIENNKIKIFEPAQEGQTINILASAKKITEVILSGGKTVKLVMDLVEPEINSDSINSLGLISLLGRGESNFAGSPTNRKFNLALGASKLNGTLIEPDEEFSFAMYIGEIDEKNGYLPELVIKNKQTIPEYGGGMCQVSTTLFRAAVNSGLKITDRHPHAYPVHYYDPPGFDATVYPPNPDLKFINDTPNYILIQSEIQGTKLIFEFYGTNDGREIKIIGPTITQSNPDGSLKTILTQQIWRDGVLERQDIFRSSYNSPSLYPTIRQTSPIPTPSPSITPAPTL